MDNKKMRPWELVTVSEYNNSLIYFRLETFGLEHVARTFRLILSTCLFWFSNSEPMSKAIFRKLPIIVLTCPMFSSISSSRASFVILSRVNKDNVVPAMKTPHPPPPLPADIAGLWTDSVPIIHHTLGLIVYYLSVIVTLPGSVVFLEWGTPAKR